MADKQNARVPIRETFILPSHGKVYQNIPEKITLRAMTTMDEKIRLSSSGISSFVALFIFHFTSLFVLHYLLYTCLYYLSIKKRRNLFPLKIPTKIIFLFYLVHLNQQ